MAVKIISINPPVEVKQRAVCRACGATLEFVQNDVQKYSGRDINGGPDSREWITCANCGKDVVLRSW
jgi:predicted RNA-binding Zn-ribbon protein involved in translation (DUF1610 family)